MYRLVALVAATPLAVGTGTLLASTAQASGPPVEHVSTTGTDTGNCVSSPCATINYAIAQAPAGQTIRVAAGVYNQTVDVNKPVRLVGAGASTTKIDGNGLDPSSNGYYGVVYVGSTGGLATVNGFTITNPYPDSYTGGEPEAVALADPNASDTVDVVNNIITDGTSDANAGNDFPIGIDTFQNYATTDISHNQISGFFQAALLEDNGPATVSHNTISDEIASGGFPAEGFFFLSDLGGAITGQNASSNTFSGYSGYGIAMAAGYSGGNCTGTGCNGSLSGSATSNSFALTGGTTTAAIALRSQFTGNDLTVTVTKNHGYVTAPSVSTSEQATDGGTLSVTESGDNIAVHSASAATMTTAGTALRVPHHHA